MKRSKYLFLFGIVIFFAFILIATKKNFPCEGDCQIVHDLNNAISQNRTDYFIGLSRFRYGQVNDTLCVHVKDTLGINWSNFADTICQVATQYGLLQQKLIITSSNMGQLDTLLIKNCP